MCKNLNRLAAAEEHQSGRLSIALLPVSKLSLGLETTCPILRESSLDSLNIRAGDIVRAELLVEVELDTGVRSRVELGEVAATIDGCGAATSDLEVDALGVSLSTVVL